jgi:hypothetical protein
MKILFLDIDGVLNNSSFRGEFGDFDPSKVRLLLDIIVKTNCNIVISSSWKIGPMDNIINGIKISLKESSLIVNSIIGATKDIDMYDRAVEIKLWISDAENDGMIIDKWCAVDDLPLNLSDDHFVQTNDDIGLTEYLTDIIIDKLME